MASNVTDEPLADPAVFAMADQNVDVPLPAANPGGHDQRRIWLNHRRALWELQTINEVSDRVAHSLEIKGILSGALDTLCRAFQVVNAAVRLKHPVTGEFDVEAVIGDETVRRLWTGNGGPLGRPSDTVIATQRPVVLEDLAKSVPSVDPERLVARSAISVPMVVGDELIGTLSLTHAKPGRFSVADQRLLSIIGGHIGVAVQNARLHAVVRRGKQDWEQTFDAIADPIGVFDSHGVLLRGNAALASFVGCDIRDLPGRMCRDVGLCGGNCAPTKRGCADGRARSFQITTADGQIFAVTTFPTAGSGKGALVQVAKNVTREIANVRQMQRLSDELTNANERLVATLAQLKNTQTQLLQAEKLSAIGVLVAGVAHELNNPLTSVIGYAQLLQEEVRDGAGSLDPVSLHQDLRRIADEAERAAKIVRNLLAFARRQSAERSLHDVNDIVERTLSLREYAMRSAGTVLDKELSSGLPRVLADATQIQQAVLNLILNAEQAIRGRPLKSLRVRTRYDEASAAVEISISDSGHGIAPANISRIFDPFFTTREVGEGTGLGLSICYGIIRDHGGQIVVDSRVGDGTTFQVLLPAQLDRPKPVNVLVAHTPKGEQEVVASALAAWGYRVTSTPSSDAALAAYQPGDFDLLLVEARLLTDTVPAWSAARERDPASAPLVVMGQPENREVERFACAEASATLAPPFQLRSLRSAIRAVCEECV